VVSCITTSIMTAPCSLRIGPFARLQKKPKHGGLERGSVTQDFVMQTRGAGEGPMGGR
jgi:hypothetical protein